MPDIPRLSGWRRAYAALLHLYPRAFRDRFGEGMRQTFNDMCRERTAAGGRLWPFALATFAETSVGAARERTVQFMNLKSFARVALVTAAILLVPLVADVVSADFDWSAADFAVAALLLLAAGTGFEILASRARPRVYRAAVGVAVGASLLLVWANLAVGIVGAADEPANLLFFAVPLVALVGALLGRFTPGGMARALFATAAAQAIVAVLAVAIRRQPASPELPVIVLAANLVFVLLFVFAAVLFRSAAPAAPARG